MSNFFLKIILSIIYFSASACSKIYAQGGGVTLKDCFSLALQRSTSISLSIDQIDKTEAQIRQARAAYLPTFSLQASLVQQDESTNSVANSLYSTKQSTTHINLNQNLFQGFRDMASVSQRKNLKLGFEWAKKQAIQQLYKDVAQTFFSILIFQSDMALYRYQIESTNKRKSELSKAKRSGRARDSDILTAESSIANLEAAISRTEGQVVTYHEAFTYLTGLRKDIKLIDSTKLPSDFGSIELWTQKFDQRPDVQKSKSDLLASEDGIEYAKSGFYPSVGLNANYYLSRPNGLFKGVDWDTSLTVSFPFFSGGLTRAQVAEANTIKNSKALALQQTQEAAQQAIRTALATLRADFDQLEKLEKASELSRRSYNLVHRDNHLGVATNTDVLTALQVWQESKRNLERIRITTIFDYTKLLLETSQDIDQISRRNK